MPTSIVYWVRNCLLLSVSQCYQFPYQTFILSNASLVGHHLPLQFTSMLCTFATGLLLGFQHILGLAHAESQSFLFSIFIIDTYP